MIRIIGLLINRGWCISKNCQSQPLEIDELYHPLIGGVETSRPRGQFRRICRTSTCQNYLISIWPLSYFDITLDIEGLINYFRLKTLCTTSTLKSIALNQKRRESDNILDSDTFRPYPFVSLRFRLSYYITICKPEIMTILCDS